MITPKTLKQALVDAERFVAAAKALQAKQALPPKTSTWNGGAYTYAPSTGKEHAAVKRASMDLTRKLADLRASR